MESTDWRPSGCGLTHVPFGVDDGCARHPDWAQRGSISGLHWNEDALAPFLGEVRCPQRGQGVKAATLPFSGRRGYERG